MSRDSGAGAYSHGIAWPSPRPQLDGERSPAGTRLCLRVGGHARHYGTRSGSMPPRPYHLGHADRPRRVCRCGRPRRPAVAARVDRRHSPRPAVAGSWTTIAATAPVAADRGRGRRRTAAGSGSPAGCGRTERRATRCSSSTRRPGPGRAGRSSPRRSTTRRWSRPRTGLVLVGGYVGDALSVATAAVRRLDDGATAWTDDAPLPDARAAGAAAFDGTRIVYAGGVKPGGVANEVFARTGDGAWATDRAPAGRARAPRGDLGRCRADVRARRARRRPRQATSRSSTSSRATPSRPSASCRPRAAAWRRSGGRRSAPAWPAASRRAARTRRSSA